MTSQESKDVDLQGRMKFADEVAADVLPHVDRSIYGGSWIDQQNNGSLVVYLTDLKPAIQDAVRARMPNTRDRGVTFVKVKHTESRLVEAIDEVLVSWELAQGPRALSAGVDAPSNGVFVRVLASDVTQAEAVADEVAASVGVPVSLRYVSAPGGDVAQTCTSRNNCFNPHEAGILIKEGAVGGSPACTLAWPIKIGTDIQAVTAGHCGHYGNNWFHSNGLVGGITANKWQSGGRDIMRIQMPNAQASENVYGTSSPSSYGPEQLTQANDPVPGETVCVSLGMSNRNDCGRVEALSVKYWSDTVGFWVFGASLVLNDFLPRPIDGDSGSPISRKYQYLQPGTPHWRHTPIGVLTTEFGEFAKLVTTLGDWNAVIYTG
jgi:hypothetical protein